jgi:hypothetical protein
MLLSILYLALAAICDAQMDTLKNKFTASNFWSVTMPKVLVKYHVFKDITSATSWLDTNSWTLAYINGDKAQGPIMWNVLGLKIKKPSEFVDAWHLIKGCMIFCLILAVIAALHPTIGRAGLDFCIFSLVWFLGFQLTYNTK